MAVGSQLYSKPSVSAAAPKKDDIPPSELWAKLAKATRPTLEVDFPRKDPTTGQPIGKMLMRPLTQGEIIQAQSAALLFAKKMVKENADLAAAIENSPVYQNACACEILFLACRRIDNANLPVFPTAESVRDPSVGLTNDECAVLMNEYEFVQLQLGPIAAYLTGDQREAFIKRLEEGGSALPLASLSLAQWTELTMHLVSQLAKSRTLSGSAGTPQEEPTLNSQSE
jgi:hypothetical protein